MASGMAVVRKPGQPRDFRCFRDSCAGTRRRQTLACLPEFHPHVITAPSASANHGAFMPPARQFLNRGLPLAVALVAALAGFGFRAPAPVITPPPPPPKPPLSF